MEILFCFNNGKENAFSLKAGFVSSTHLLNYTKLPCKYATHLHKY